VARPKNRTRTPGKRERRRTGRPAGSACHQHTPCSRWPDRNKPSLRLVSASLQALHRASAPLCARRAKPRQLAAFPAVRPINSNLRLRRNESCPSIGTPLEQLLPLPAHSFMCIKGQQNSFTVAIANVLSWQKRRTNTNCCLAAKQSAIKIRRSTYLWNKNPIPGTKQANLAAPLCAAPKKLPRRRANLEDRAAGKETTKPCHVRNRWGLCQRLCKHPCTRKNSEGLRPSARKDRETPRRKRNAGE
jgi:hypothetical protein